jgi:hypothetical protein
MTEEERRKLLFIKEKIPEGSYQILPPQQWDQFSHDLGDCGAKNLKELENARERIHELKVHLFFFLSKKTLTHMDANCDDVTRDFYLFFDASMRWLKSIINGNEYKESQILQRDYVEKLTDHCSRMLEHLNNSISSKRSDYYHYQALFWSMVAIFVAALSVIISIIL